MFALAGLIAGLSGGLYAFHEGYVGPGQLGPVLSTQVVLYVLFGGVGTLVGAVIGVGIIDLFSFSCPSSWETGWPIVLGLLLLVVVMFRPTGLIGFLVSERERVGSFGSASADGKADAGRGRDGRVHAVIAMDSEANLLEVRGVGRSTRPSPRSDGVDLTVAQARSMG